MSAEIMQAIGRLEAMAETTVKDIGEIKEGLKEGLKDHDTRLREGETFRARFRGTVWGLTGLTGLGGVGEAIRRFFG